jgi:hypothetical protein
MVEKDKTIKQDCLMESNPDFNPLLLGESKQKHGSLLGRVYERFLELPVPVVLAVLWLAGVALIGLCGVTFYFLWLLLYALAGG